MIPTYLDTPPLVNAHEKSGPDETPKADPVNEGRCECDRPRGWMAEDTCRWCESW